MNCILLASPVARIAITHHHAELSFFLKVSATEHLRVKLSVQHAAPGWLCGHGEESAAFRNDQEPCLCASVWRLLSQPLWCPESGSEGAAGSVLLSCLLLMFVCCCFSLIGFSVRGWNTSFVLLSPQPPVHAHAVLPPWMNRPESAPTVVECQGLVAFPEKQHSLPASPASFSAP